MPTNQAECWELFLLAARDVKACYPSQYRAIVGQMVKEWPSDNTVEDRQMAFRLFLRIASST